MGMPRSGRPGEEAFVPRALLRKVEIVQYGVEILPRYRSGAQNGPAPAGGGVRPGGDGRVEPGFALASVDDRFGPAFHGRSGHGEVVGLGFPERLAEARVGVPAAFRKSRPDGGMHADGIESCGYHTLTAFLQ